MSSRDAAHLGKCEAAVERVLAELRVERVVERMWQGDHTVWGPNPEEITNRLGRLRSPEVTERALPEILGLAEAMRADSLEHALLLGMGVSSLAPETFARSLSCKDGYPDPAVLDSTDPETVLANAGGLDLARKLFVVSTKSGGTVETFSFFKYFYNRVGGRRRGACQLALRRIIEPGGGLQDTAERFGFRATFLNDPNIGA